MGLMAKRIAQSAQQRSVKVSIFGSALGSEVRDALLRVSDCDRRRVHVALLDLDPAAIEFATRQLAPTLPPEQLSAVAMNLFRLPDRPAAAELVAGSDLLFCPGIFDYLDDDAAAAMLRTLYGQLAPGGRLVVFQFTPENPTRAYMEWFANWYLIYRDARQLRSLAAAADIPEPLARLGPAHLGLETLEASAPSYQ
jgi:SAM-dependent methyltransferase